MSISIVNLKHVQNKHLTHLSVFSGDHQAILSKVANCGILLIESLRAHGFSVAREAAFTSLEPDDVKFFLKQQRKCLADSQNSKEQGSLSFYIHDIVCILYGYVMF